jgi:hypothetical protein
LGNFYNKNRKYSLVSQIRRKGYLLIGLIFSILSQFSVLIAQEDTIQIAPIHYGVNKSIESTIHYTAVDSIISSLKNKQVKLYNEAIVDYQDFHLEAGYIFIDMKSNEIFASGFLDSTNTVQQTPVFTQGGKEYKVDTLRFHLQTKKGKIKQLNTQEGEGFLFGYDIKRKKDNSFNFKKGRYTTCNHPEPHFYIEARKMKFTDDKKVFSGPAQLVIAGVKTPLILPFGYFPLKEKKTFGILLPRYNFTQSRGYGITDLGFYLGISDYWDNTLELDVYSSGSFALRNFTRYKKRYGFYGNLNIGYSSTKNVITSGNLPKRQSEYSVRWVHQQDAKANPFGNFSANVDMTSGNFNTNNNESLYNLVRNEYTSTISYNRNILRNRFNISLTANHNMTNTGKRPVTLTLPNLNLRTNGNIYPFKNVLPETSNSFLKKINFTPSLETKALVHTFDSLMFTGNMFDSVRTGAKYNVPFSLPINVSPILSITPSLGYTGFLYPEKYAYSYNQQLDTVQISKTRGIYHTSDINSSLGLTLRPQLYGFFHFKRGRLQAIRHMILPTIRYTYNFNFLDRNRNDQYIAETNKWYRTFGNNTIFSAPGSASLIQERKYGRIHLTLNNTLDIKVKKNPKDTTIKEDYKKVKIFDLFQFSTNYDLDVDSFNLARIDWQANFSPIKRLNLRFNSTIDPYLIEDGKRKNILFFEKGGKGKFRFDHFQSNISYSFSGKPKKGQSLQSKIENRRKMGELSAIEEQELNDIERYSDRYMDFDIPYTLNLGLVTTAKRNDDDKFEIVPVFSVGGDFNLTQTLKLDFRTGYDFKMNEFSHSTFGLVKDIHCWEFSFDWTPTGVYSRYSFQINAKASVLQGLKLSKNTPAFDDTFF